jgi:hypothetical protein
LFLLISIYSFSLLFTIFYPYFLFVGYFVEGSQREALMGVLTAPEQATQLTINEAMNQAFGTSSEEDEGKEDEGGGGQRGGDGRGQQHNYRFLFLVNFYSQLD